MTLLRARRQRGVPVLFRLLADYDYPPDSLRAHLFHDACGTQMTLHGLTACHRYGVVEQYLVRDVHASLNRGPDGQRPGVAVRAVTEVLKYVPRAGKGREPNPLRSLSSHVAYG